MRYEIVPKPEVARKAIAEMVAHRVVSRLEKRFATAEDGKVAVMSNEDLRNYEIELTSLVMETIKKVGAVDLDVFLAHHQIEPDESNLAHFSVLLDAMKIHHERNLRYKDQWKESGWMGALYDMRKKAARLFRQYFGEQPTEGANEDDAWDLINFAAFFIRGRSAKNKWGTWL